VRPLSESRSRRVLPEDGLKETIAYFRALLAE
jgi:hypothetical protein